VFHLLAASESAFFKEGHANEITESNCHTILVGMIICLIIEDFMSGIQRIFRCSNAMGLTSAWNICWQILGISQ